MKLIIGIILSLSAFFFSSAQTLDDYLKLATDNNPGLSAKYHAYQASTQMFAQVGALDDPILTFGYFISPIETRVGPQEFRVSAMQWFPWVGTLKAKKEAAGVYALSKLEEYETAKKELHYNVKFTFYRLYELEQTIKITKQNIAILKTYERLIEQKFETGDNSMIDILRIQLEIAEEGDQLILMEEKRVPLIAAFNQYINENVDEPVIIPDTLDPVILLYDKEILTKNILLKNNQVASLEYRQMSVERLIKVAKKEGAPRFGFGITYIGVKERTDISIPNNGRNAFMPMLSVSLPIYRSKYKAKLNQAFFQLDELHDIKIDVQNKLRTQVELNWQEYEDASRRIELNTNQKKTITKMISLLIEQYMTAGINFEEILRMQQSELNYEKALFKAIADKNIAIASIEALNN